ncbi:ankyrin repeat-containing protein At5g02620-like [Phragmites australis]|uniref:ankyrin repeat-containing protein At5g02620-like n=1 Tax=Phragmites australis TaxID=29695 RepID=UPI002D76942F|nr:ankyrin repeat-containing protein At5g02620-like [Phragmites australis]
MSTPASMNPFLLASACFGSWRALSVLLSREDGPADAVSTQAFLDLLEASSSPETQEASDVEEGADQTAWPPAPILEGVTADGDTALHVLATCGDGDNFLRSADIVYHKARYLLVAQNSKGDTPLHCAARAGRPKMVSRLIALARGEANIGEMLKEVVRKENGRKETALHEAVRLGSKHTVELLMAADSELASFPKEGTSPLYLAILLERIDIVQSLYVMSGGNLSYSGPNGQNALHAAVLRGQDMTEMLLRWNIGLAIQGDQNGSTPLHFATSVLRPRGVHFWIHSPWFPWERGVWHSGMPFKQVLEANLATMCQSDDKGLYPVHTATYIGANKAIVKFLEKCPNIAGLRDIKGRSFLHVAVEKKRWHIVTHACNTPSLSWIWNMQDIDGNTALHLAVKHEVQDIFCLLLENLEVHLNITNNNGETPLDLSESKMRAGSFWSWSPKFLINSALKYCHAKHGNRRLDHFEEQYIQPLDEEKESEKLTSSTQTLGLGSAIMATVAFGASFNLPGGYKDDGTPALSGRYVFDAFVAANSLAFACAGLATINLMYSGTAIVDVPLRVRHFDIALFFAFGSVTSLGTACALGLYVTLAPVAYMTATGICVVASVLSLCAFIDPMRGRAVARALYARLGNQALLIFARIIILRGAMVYWPLVTSFISAAISAKYRHK